MRSKKAAANVAVLMLYEIVTMICGLVLPRLILLAFGSAYNGMISSITQIISFIAILRAGIAGATRVSLYKTLADKDTGKTSAILRATESYLRKIAYAFLVYLLILAVAYPLILHTAVPHLETGMLVVIIGMGTFAQYYFGITYQTLLAADQRQYIYYIIQTVTTILNTLVSVIIIKTGASVQVVKLGSAMVFVLSPIALNVYVSKKYRLNKRCKPNKEALNQRWDVLGLAVANIIHDNTDIVVLTVCASVELVSVYTIYNLVIGSLVKILSVFTTGLEAAFGNMFAKGEHDSIEKNIRLYEMIIYAFISVVFSCTGLLILPFVQVYTKGVTDVRYIWPLYAGVATLATAFYCVRIPYLTLVQAAGHYRQTRNGAFVEAGINLFFSVGLVFKFGLVGVAVGTLMSDIFRTVQYGAYCCKYLVEMSFPHIIKRCLWSYANVVIIILIGHCLPYQAADSWMIWLVSAVGYFVIAAVVTAVTSAIFYKDDLMAAFTFINRLLGREPLKKC